MSENDSNAGLITMDVKFTDQDLIRLEFNRDGEQLLWVELTRAKAAQWSASIAAAYFMYRGENGEIVFRARYESRLMFFALVITLCTAAGQCQAAPLQIITAQDLMTCQRDVAIAADEFRRAHPDLIVRDAYCAPAS